MSVRRKIAVLSIIGFGACAVVIACFRLIPLFELNSSSDFSYVLGKMVIVAALEIQFAVIAVNLPSIKALWLRITGGSSACSGLEHSDQRGYRLSSIAKRGGSSGAAIHRNRHGLNRNSKGSKGDTRLDPGVLSTESEEELFRQCGTELHTPIQGVRKIDDNIKVTTDIHVTNMGTEDDDVSLKRFLGNH